jgi:hypothetical protein
MTWDSKVGKDCKVTLGANTVLGLGTWQLGGGQTAELDDTEFLDEYTTFKLGIVTSGTISFSGLYKPDDTQGQQMIIAAFHAKSDITDMRLYIDETSYYTPNSTTAAGGGLLAESPVSHLNIVGEPQISADKGGLVQISFSARLSGVLRLI